DTAALNANGGWLAAEDTVITNAAQGATYRIRISAANTGFAQESAARTYKIQYGTKATTCAAIGSWSDTGDTKFAMAATTAVNPDGQATTALLTNGESYSFTAGEGRDTAITTGAIGPLDPDDYTEIEYSIAPGTGAAAGTTYCLRLYDTTAGSALNTYTQYPAVTMDTCGSGFVTGAEECDDGNVLPGDGCSALCTAEHGFSCIGEPSTCTSTCGDSLVASNEGCDDGDVTSGDGCSLLCAIENGWSCIGEPSVCTTGCGDGIIAGSETCDDGGFVSEDGCSGACAIESGWTCAGTPSVCRTSCGDSIVAGTEECEPPSTSVCDASCQSTVTTGTEGQTGGALPDDEENPVEDLSECGNGILETGEECDNGNLNELTACSETCKKLSCGDGIVSYKIGEECEPKRRTGGGFTEVPFCSKTAGDTACTSPDDERGGCRILTVPLCPLFSGGEPIPLAAPLEKIFCGNGRKDANEECDYGGVCFGGKYQGSWWKGFGGALLCRASGGVTIPMSGDGCSSLCTMEFCGDGSVQSGEDCDAGSVCSNDGTRSCRTLSDCADEEGVSCRQVSTPYCSRTCKACGGGYTADIDLSSVQEGTHILKVQVKNLCGASSVAETSLTLSARLEFFRLPSPSFAKLVRETSAPTVVSDGRIAPRLSVIAGKAAYLSGTETVAHLRVLVTDADGVPLTELLPESFAIGIDGVRVQGVSFEEVRETGCTRTQEDFKRISVCTDPRTTALCGNGIRDGTETCDDGNLLGGDGCSFDCLLPHLWLK
ncbi:MAG: DUF4215 domain-containing protein, partial [Candidatus Peregrinibacteria bacterium]